MVNVLVLCTGNSARSVLSEAIINERGKGRFQAFSAGSKPTGKVNPFAIKLLDAKGYDTSGFRSKSWDEFARPDAPEMDIVITVCDSAAGETCPIWPGAPVQVHWGFPDPAYVEGTDDEKLQAFSDVYDMIDPFIEQLVALDVEKKDAGTLKAALRAIADRTG
ncbi:arsenate reductase ArsC [Kordiimonas lacus]|uniref:Arsenate reductase n=1 Tax=Kordiimonas lacus TaxID=637679 RepID=A0A1G6ZVI6_9PROT|nr:arsenate reductase ArsC [Kordiimonas lacus]SDE06540.1 arsenate reductase [Kordiimonas lacus]